jgi:hypothetical protein
VAHPVILATQEAEIRRITVRSQPRQIVHEIYLKKILNKNRDGGVAQGVGPEFKPQYHKKKKIITKEKRAGGVAQGVGTEFMPWY